MRPFSPVFFFVLCFCGVARAGFCAEISKLLGDDCKVAETDCLRITCVIDLLHVETIDVDLDLHGICSANPSIKFTVAEKEFSIHYKKVVGEGSDVEFPIPGLTIGIPLLPVKAGVYGAATIAGKEDDLKLFLGIDAAPRLSLPNVAQSYLRIFLTGSYTVRSMRQMYVQLQRRLHTRPPQRPLTLQHNASK